MDDDYGSFVTADDERSTQRQGRQQQHHQHHMSHPHHSLQQQHPHHQQHYERSPHPPPPPPHRAPSYGAPVAGPPRSIGTPNYDHPYVKLEWQSLEKLVKTLDVELDEHRSELKYVSATAEARALSEEALRRKTAGSS